MIYVGQDCYSLLGIVNFSLMLKMGKFRYFSFQHPFGHGDVIKNLSRRAGSGLSLKYLDESIVDPSE